MIGDGGLLLELLEEEDPKVRKNVAMILGELEWMGLQMHLLRHMKGADSFCKKHVFKGTCLS